MGTLRKLYLEGLLLKGKECALNRGKLTFKGKECALSGSLIFLKELTHSDNDGKNENGEDASFENKPIKLSNLQGEIILE